MNCYIAYRYRLYPTELQQQKLNIYFNIAWNYWNYLVKCRKTYAYALKQERTDFIRKYRITVLYESYFQFIESNFLNACRKGQRCPSEHKAGCHLSFSFKYNSRNLLIGDDSVMICGISNIPLIMHRPLPSCRHIFRFTVSKDANGEYYLSILVAVKPHSQVRFIRTSIGLDFDLKYLYVDSNGNRAEFPSFYQKQLVRIRKMQKSLKGKKKDSHHYKETRRKISDIYKHIANQRKDYLNKLSSALVEDNDLIAVETLDLQSMSSRKSKHKFGRRVYDESYHEFLEMLRYKCLLYGKVFIKVNKYFPSSKKCSACGNINSTFPLEERVYHCTKCGVEIDRDINAAINIKREGERLYSQITHNNA